MERGTESVLTFEVLGVLDVDFLIQLKCLLVVSHAAKAARNHQSPFHLGNVTRDSNTWALSSQP